MNTVSRLKYYIEALCVYDLRGDGIISSLLELLKSTESEAVLEKQSRFFRLVSEQKSLRDYISRLVLSNANAFSRAAAAGRESELPEAVISGVKSDLEKLEAIATVTPADIAEAVGESDLKAVLKTLPAWENGTPAAPLTENWAEQLDALCAYHRKNGYGDFAKYTAFHWRGQRLVPIEATDPIRLTDLKNYELPRSKVVNNTESFLNGHPSNNVLLYGDRGTGKSSTVHAVLNEYAPQGLRMIELAKSDITELPLIRERLSKSPMKFIIFIDDLCFDSHEDSFGSLKAALEGSLSGNNENIIIYATSNRRHLIKESFSDRENDVHRNDVMQEQLSLSDRFGLTITFVNPDKKDYLDIVEKLAADRGLKVDSDRLCAAAERWAITRGGRSPRCAKQFVDFVESAEKSGKNW